MPTYTITPANQAQYQTTNAGDHAVDLAAGDGVEVQAGALVSATGANADGIFASGLTEVGIIGTVLSTQGNGMSGNYAAFIIPTGTVSGGQLGIRFTGGGNHLANQGAITGASGIEFSTAGLQQTVLNEGTITGTAQNGAVLRGHVYLTNIGSIVGLQSGIIAPDRGTFSISNLGLIRGGQEGYAIDIQSGSAFATIVNSGRIEGRMNSNAQVYYEGRGGIVTGQITLGMKNDTAYGGAATEMMYGNASDDFLHGGAGNDILDGGQGNDTLNGGDGFDTAVFSDELPNGSYINVANPGDAANTHGADTYISIEAFIGTSFADHFIGDGNANTFTGKAGNDTLDGAGGNDMLVQEAADGNDSLVGGTGIDTVSFSGTAGAVINLALATAQTTAYGSDILSGIENLSGGSGNDVFTGDSFANVLRGNDGTDILKGMSGNDLLYGGADHDRLSGGSENDRLLGENGNDLLYGDAGNDVLSGGNHNDKLYGGAGKDVLTGGTGRDIFVFNTALNRSTNVDRITDFSVRDDTIWLDNRYMAKLGAGSETRPGRLNSKYLAFDSAKDADDYLIYVRKTGALLYDADGSGSGAAVAIAVLTKNLKLTAADFQII